MKIIVAGLNHKSTPVNIREKLAFDAGETIKALNELKSKFDRAEFVLLSTCNRVEIYCACSESAEVDEKVLTGFLSDFHGIPRERFHEFIYAYKNVDAVRHLLTVTASLDSMVVGEAQITGQVKESYKLACGTKSVGKFLNRLFHCAFATSKKIVTNTSILNGRVSVAGVAVELAMQLFYDITCAKVAVIGAGEMGELLVRHLLHSGCKNITIANCSPQRGLEMARKYDVSSINWDQLNGLLAEVDIVIASAASQNYLFEEKTFRTVMHHRKKRPLLIIDLAVPLNFAPDVIKIEDIYLYSIDELSEAAQQNLKAREDDIAKALRIIDENVRGFMDWLGTRNIGPAIGEMKNVFAQISRREIDNFFVGTRENASCRAAMEAMTSKVVNRVLHCVIKGSL
ncbi:MAG: glutamyl-tRNA reductase [Phycisphaerae bacterium]|nr:glutamyl-tRNA reductase [Phycisphaerae bacterium]